MSENPMPLALFSSPAVASWAKLVEALDALAAEDEELENFLRRALPPGTHEGAEPCATLGS